MIGEGVFGYHVMIVCYLADPLILGSRLLMTFNWYFRFLKVDHQRNHVEHHSFVKGHVC
jgi:hypothetical protein